MLDCGRYLRNRSASLLLAVIVSGCAQAPPAPDVILITLDTTRVDRIGAYGYAGETTPHLDELAGQGLRFDRAWSTSPWTLPAHASMLTGKYPARHGAHFGREDADTGLGEVIPGEDRFAVNRLPESEFTLAERLAERGYATAAFVAGPWLAPPFGLLQGYAVHEARAHDPGGQTASEITDAALSWIAQTEPGQPLHLLLNYFDAHFPYQPPNEHERAFQPANAREAQRHREFRLYDGEIRYMDAQIGRLFDALKRAGRYEGALIIAVSDHGELFGEHGLQRHGYYLFEELIRAPLIVRLPGGRRAGEVIDATVSVVDLLPLVADEIGFAIEGDFDGLPIGSRRWALAESYRNASIKTVRGRSVDRDLVAAISWPWKRIESSRGEVSLYRLDRDPTEQRPVDQSDEADQLGREVAAARASMRPAVPAQSPRGITPETAERLRELGYVD
jgi:arylsulfatase A-like enzyme